MHVSRITGEEAGTLTEVLAESPNKGPGPAALAMHSLHWTGHAGKGVRRAVRQPPTPQHPSHYTAYWPTQHTEQPIPFAHFSFYLMEFPATP